jgi:hydroxymethylpyrimidine pyrophosphatase-like HAD family hydrolase
MGSLRKIFAKNGLFIGQPLPFPLILQNGAVLYAQGERLLAHFRFGDEVQAQLIQVLYPFHQASVLFFDLDGIYSMHGNGPAQEEIISLDFYAGSFPENSRLYQFSKAMCFQMIRKFSRPSGGDKTTGCWNLSKPALCHRSLPHRC